VLPLLGTQFFDLTGVITFAHTCGFLPISCSHSHLNRQAECGVQGGPLWFTAVLGKVHY